MYCFLILWITIRFSLASNTTAKYQRITNKKYEQQRSISPEAVIGIKNANPQIITKRYQSAYSPSMHSMSHNKSRDSLSFAGASNTRQLSKSEDVKSWKAKILRSR